MWSPARFTNASPTIIGIAIPRKIATPPPSGFALACTFRPPGLSTNPIRGAIRIIAYVSNHDRTKLTPPRIRMGPSMQGSKDYRRKADSFQSLAGAKKRRPGSNQASFGSFGAQIFYGQSLAKSTDFLTAVACEGTQSAAR